jgi:hypothetical protein
MRARPKELTWAPRPYPLPGTARANRVLRRSPSTPAHDRTSLARNSPCADPA